MPPVLTYWELFLGGDPFPKVVRYDPWDSMTPSETPPGTSCPPQPQLGGIRTPPVLTYLEPFLGGDSSTKDVRYDPWDTVIASETTLRNLLSSTTPFRRPKDTPR